MAIFESALTIPYFPGSEEIMQECTKEILKAEKRDKMARKKAYKQRQKASAAKAWEPSKRNIADHLKFVLTACMDEYAATVASIKKYIATHYAAEFDLANKIGRFKNVRRGALSSIMCCGVGSGSLTSFWP